MVTSRGLRRGAGICPASVGGGGGCILGGAAEQGQCCSIRDAGPPAPLLSNMHQRGHPPVEGRVPSGSRATGRPASVATVSGALETAQRASLPVLLGARDLKAENSTTSSQI